MKPTSESLLNAIETESGNSRIYTMDSNKFISELFSRFMPFWMWILVGLILAGGLISSFFDLRWLIVALMIVLIIFPAIAGFLYYSYALSRECFINRLPHSIGMVNDNLEVSLYIKELKENITESEEVAEEETYRIRKEIFQKHNIGNMEMKTSGAYLTISDRHKGFLFIPYDAFENQADFQYFITKLKSLSDENFKG